MVQLPFIKKKEPEMIAGKGYPPIDRVKEMAGRGFSEPEMIDVLRREGFSAEEIDRALSQALRIGVTSQSPAPTVNPNPSHLPTLEELMPTEPPQGNPQIPETSLPQDYYEQNYSTEEYFDTLIQSRVSGWTEKINEFAVRYEEIEKRVATIQDQLSELSKIRSGEQQEILNKIDVFSETVTDSNTRITSLERAFKEILPALIESVRGLSDLVQKMKKESH